MEKPPAVKVDPQLLLAMDRYYGLPESYNSWNDSRQIPPKLGKKKRYRILLTTFWTYPHTGGLSNYITSFKKEFEALGHKVDVIAPNHFSSEEYSDRRKKLKKQYNTFLLERYGTTSRRIVRNLTDLTLYEEILQEKNLKKYDILHAQDLFTAFILTRLNKKLNKPLYFTPHGTFTKSRLKFNTIEHGSIEEAYYSEIEKKAIKGAKNIIILADSFREPLSDFGASDDQMITVHTGINMKKVKKVEKSGKDPLVISCVARLGPRKGHTYLLEALSIIRQSLDHVEVWIVGDGETRESLEEQTKSLNLSCVQFLGSRDDIPDILSKSDIFVLPTINDNLPICLIEAMFAEQAIVTTDCGGITEIIHDGETGLIAEPGNAEQLSLHLLTFIQNKKKRKDFAKKAKRFAEIHLTANTMAKKILEVYKR